MPEKHFYFSLGAMVGSIICGLIAKLPDIFHALGVFPKEVTRSPMFDIFFFHSTFEQIENTMPVIDRYLNWLGQLFLVVIALGTMLYYIYQAKQALKLASKKSTK